MHYDLRNASLPELETFVFDHPSVEDAEGASRQEWYWREELAVEIEPTRQLELALSLFSNSAELRWKYSEDQLEQGLWFLFGPGGEEWFAGLLRDRSVPLTVRRRFVESIFALYEGLLSRVQLDTATFMLWDLLIDLLHRGPADDVAVPHELETVVFTTLVRILAIPDLECQRAALHGLGHLHHSETATVVADYLSRNSALPDELAEYAGRVRDGQAIL